MIGIYYTEDLMQKWFIRNLPKARKVLENFKSLNTLLDGFRNYESKRYRDVRNAIMFMCLPEVGKGLNSKSINRLTILEETIKSFDIMNWSAKKLTDFRSKLASEGYIQSFSVVTELEVASKMVEKFGRDNVELYPSLTTGGLSDIGVRVDDKDVFLELGNLGESLPERKIQKIIETAAKHLGEKITTQCYLQLIINTAELVFDDDGRIQVPASIKKLKSEIDKLQLHKLAGFSGFFNFDDMAFAIEYLLRYENVKQWFNPMDQRLLKLLSSEKIKKWLSCINTKFLREVELIKGIIAGSETSTLLVEVHTESFYPSKAAMSEQASFLNHITRNIEGQIEEDQLQPDAPNIVVVQGYSWTLLGFDLLILKSLDTQLQNFFERRKEAHLGGVAFYGTEFEKAVYIGNKLAKKSSQLNREDINKLGFRWLDLP